MLLTRVRVVTRFNLSGKNRFIQQKNVHKSQKKQSRFKNQSIFKFLLFICSVGNNTFLQKLALRIDLINSLTSSEDKPWLPVHFSTAI